ncbi:MAG: DsbA family protein [Pseudomonadota bacterium]
MTAEIDAYFSFRSPYSYLATPGMLRLQADFDAKVNLRPVLPLAIRQPDFFSPENIKRARYIMMDYPRRAEMLGMAKGWPSPDPIVQDLQTYKISEDQPYIHRLTQLGVEAQRRGKGAEFAYEVSHLIFGGTPDWDKGEHLAEAAARAGLNLAEMEAAREGGDHADVIAANQASLEAAGHWGVPTLVYDNEPFFGEDRIDTLRWRLEQRGVAKRG